MQMPTTNTMLRLMPALSLLAILMSTAPGLYAHELPDVAGMRCERHQRWGWDDDDTELRNVTVMDGALALTHTASLLTSNRTATATFAAEHWSYKQQGTAARDSSQHRGTFACLPPRSTLFSCFVIFSLRSH
jgi:hypothetical protein